MRRLAALALALAPGLAAAATDEGCAELLRRGGELLGMAVEAEVAAVELPTVLFGEVSGTLPWCEATGIVAVWGEGDGGLALRIDRLRWRGLDPLLEGGLPAEVWAEMEGLRLSPRTGDPAMDWLLAQRTGPRGIDGSVEAGLDATDGSIRVHALRLDAPGAGAIDLALSAEGLDLSSRAAIEASLGRAGITELSAAVLLDGLFEAVLLVPLGRAALAGSTDPEGDAARLVGSLAAQARALPAAIFRGPTREALAALASELPHPRGTLRLDVAVEEGAPLGMPRLAGPGGPPRAAEDLWAALEGVAVTATWEPLPPDLSPRSRAARGCRAPSAPRSRSPS